MEIIANELPQDLALQPGEADTFDLDGNIDSILLEIPPINAASSDADLISAICSANKLAANEDILTEISDWMQERAAKSAPVWQELMNAAKTDSQARLAAVRQAREITTDNLLQQAIINAAIGAEGDYLLRRTNIASELSVPVVNLDKLVNKCRDAYQAALPAACSSEHEPEASAARVALADDYVEPSTEPQNGREILMDYVHHIKARVYMRKDQIIVSAIYALATYCYPNFAYFPYLMVTAATKASGKTVAGETIASLCVNPLTTSGITPAAIYRIMNDGVPLTMLLDERDTVTNPDEKSNLARILNSGFQRTGRVVLCDGDNKEVRSFKTYGPKILVGIGDYLDDTTASRCIPLSMEKKPTSKNVLRTIDIEIPKYLRARAARWAQDNSGAVLDAYKSLRDSTTLGVQIGDRERDIWEPLWAVASVAMPSGDLCTQLMKLASKWGVESTYSVDDPKLMALEELCRASLVVYLRERQRARDKNNKFVPNKEMLLADKSVHEMAISISDGPWPEWRAGQPITPRSFTTLLNNWRPGGKDLKRGKIRLPTKLATRLGASSPLGSVPAHPVRVIYITPALIRTFKNNLNMWRITREVLRLWNDNQITATGPIKGF